MTKESKGKNQVKEFRKAARNLGCEDNEGLFKEALRKIAKAKPHSQKKNARGSG